MSSSCSIASCSTSSSTSVLAMELPNAKFLSEKQRRFRELVQPLVRKCSHRRGLLGRQKQFTDCFVAKQAVDTLVQAGWGDSRDEAVQQARAWMEGFDLISPVSQLRGLNRRFRDSSRQLYQFQEDGSCGDTTISTTTSNSTSFSLLSTSFRCLSASQSSASAPPPSNHPAPSLPPMISQEQVRQEIREEIQQHERKRSGLRNLVSHNRKLAAARLQSGHDVGALLCWRLVQKDQARITQAETVVTRLQELLALDRDEQTGDYYKTQLQRVLDAPPPLYMKYDDVVEDICLLLNNDEEDDDEISIHDEEEGTKRKETTPAN